MSEEIVVRLGAPTLAGIKTGSLFTCPCGSQQELLSDLRDMNRRLAPKGLCILPLRRSESRALLYLFRPKELRRDLQDRQAAKLLSREGYSCTGCGRCLTQLKKRMGKGSGFPHEIGLFLSYPPEDVQGFIDNRAGKYKLSGLWKVYGDEKKAMQLFESFRRCTDAYCRMWQAGLSLDELAVAV